MKKIISLMILVFLLLVGCAKGGLNGFDYLKASDYGSIISTSGTSDILDVLPGNMHVKGFEAATTNRLVVKYDTNILGEGYLESDDFYWEDDESYKRILLFNASVLFAENENLDNINFYVETGKNIYTVYVNRDSVEKFIYGDLTSLDISNIKSDLVSSIDDNQKIEAYYGAHAVFYIDKSEDDC